MCQVLASTLILMKSYDAGFIIPILIDENDETWNM